MARQGGEKHDAPGWSPDLTAGDGSTPMCFSSSASFTVAAVLVPAGIGAVRYCQDHHRGDLVPLALSPLFFAVQQALEGLVWLGIDGGGASSLLHGAALGYLFFAYAFWLAWLPFSALRIGSERKSPLRRGFLQGLLVLGLLGGAGLWLPLALDGALFHPQVVQGSLAYNTTLLLQERINLGFGSSLYAVIIATPLMISRSVRLRGFGAMILVAFLITHLAFGYAFTSLWCFFSAVFSSALYWIIRDPLPLAEYMDTTTVS